MRPVDTLLQVLASDMQIRRLGEAIQGLVVLGVAISLGDIAWDLGRILYLPVVVASAVLLYTALFSIEATVCFWTARGMPCRASSNIRSSFSLASSRDAA